MISALMSRTSSTGQPSRDDDETEWHVVATSCRVVEDWDDDDVRVITTFDQGTKLKVDEQASVRGQPSTGRAAIRWQEQCRGYRWLRIREPAVGWVAASDCAVGTPLLGASWRFVVVCGDGAYVREGLELASPHLYTLQKNAVFIVHERRVNDQGLARLRTDDGWLSEDLNPLSGQRGPIVVPLPVFEPLKYRVILPDGAVVRQTVELSSAIVHVVPQGEQVIVDDKQFSDHPQSHCVPRLRLVRPVSGWISQRLNREPPDDLAVVELLGLASVSDMPPPVSSERPSSEEPPASPPRRPPLSADRPRSRPRLDDDDDATVDEVDENDRRHSGDVLCVVCLSAPRNASFIHGETGHIACCLRCARALKARGDTCPVCRMHIERVIQHFWA